MSAILLGSTGTHDAQNTLLALACDEDDDALVGWCAVETLKETEVDAVRDRAASTYKAQDQPVQCRARAVYLLGWLSKDEAGSKRLVEALEDDSPIVRGFAADAVARLDLRHARGKIERFLTDPKERDPWLIRQAAQALAQIGTVESIQVLESHLDSHPDIARSNLRRAVTEIRERFAL